MGFIVPGRMILIAIFILSLVVAPFTPTVAYALNLGDIVQVAAAFASHVAVHESGHYIMAHMAGAEDVQLNFFTVQGGNIYLGLSTAKGIDPDSSLSYKAAGEAAASYLFDTALESYRAWPTTYNRSLLFFSGTDFFWYTLYAFYLSGNQNPSYDPVGISHETGLSGEAILGIATLQTTLNAYRIYSGRDDVMPYIELDKKWVEFGIRFELF
jgi:hypothetical protein